MDFNTIYEVPLLGPEDPLEKGVATHSTVLPWRIPWTEPAGSSPWDCKELDVTESTHACARTHTHTHLKYLYSNP